MSNPAVKRRKLYANSVGNTRSSLLAEQRVSKETIKNNLISKPKLGMISAAASLLSLKDCCDKGGEQGCIINHFINDEPAISWFLQQREKTRLLQKDELDTFLQEEFRRCIRKEIINSDGEITFKMKWAIEDVLLCKSSFAECYDTTPYKLESISKALKLTPSRRVKSTRIRGYTDKTIHPYTSAQIAQIFRENLSVDVES